MPIGVPTPARAFLFLNECRFVTNSVSKKINCTEEQGDNRQRKQSQLPINSHHDGERSDQRDNRCKNIRETFVVDRLDGLRIVGNAKTGITRAPRIVVLER